MTRSEEWWQTPLSELTLVAWDTETTGLENGRIVELGAIRFRGDKVLEEFPATLIHPQMAIPEAASAVHGIQDAHVMEAPSFEEVLPQFLQFVGKDLLIAHNAPFDLVILRGELERLRKRDIELYSLDTLSLSRKWLPDRPSYRLHNLVPSTNPHRALGDALCVFKLFQQIRTAAEAKLGPFCTLSQLLGNLPLLSLWNTEL